MNKLITSLLVTFAGAAISFAGPMGKDYKSAKEVPCPEFFRAGEIDFGIFGAYAGGNVDRYSKPTTFRTTEVRVREETIVLPPPLRGNSTTITETREEKITHTHRSSFRDTLHNAGGGGIEAAYFFTKNLGVSLEGTWLDGESAIHGASASFIYRYPIERCTWALAPYGFIGGGGQWDGSSVGFGHFGGGLEVRFSQRWGIFADGRWVIHDALENYALVRSGIRLVF